MKRLREAGMDYPRFVACLAALLVFALAFGSAQLRFDPSWKTFFDPDDPQRQDFEHLRAVFDPADTMVFLIDSEQALFSSPNLSALESLTEQAWQLPHATRVDSLTNYQYSRATEQGLEVSPLVEDAKSLDATALARIERVARSEPLVNGRLIERGGNATAVAVTIVADGPPLQVSQEVMAAARDLAAEFERRRPDWTIRLSGIVAMNHAFAARSLEDSALLLPVMLALMLLALRWLLASWLPVVATFTVMVGSIGGALGAAGWAGLALTTPSAIAPIVIITVCIADAVHLLLGYLRRVETLGRNAAMRESLARNQLPIALTSLTTAAGFASMNFSAVPPFRDLGNIVAIGVILGGAFTIWVIPAIMRVPHQPRAPRLPLGMLAALGPALRGRRRAVLLGAGALAVALVPGLAANRVNDDFVGYFGPDTAFRQAAEFAEAHLTGLYEIEYQLQAAAEGGIHNPDWLEQVAEFTAWLREQPEVSHVSAWTDVMKRLNRNLHGDDPEAYRLPATRALASQYTLLYELSLPQGRDATNMIAPDYGSARLVTKLDNLDSSAALAFEARAARWLERNAPLVDERHGGINLMFAHVSRRNVAAMIEGNLVAAGLIALLLAAAFRSFGLAAVSVLTNLVPIAMGFALWGYLVGEVGLSLATAFGMTLGIVVDDTVHVLSRYCAERRGGRERGSAVDAALAEVGPALVLTTGLMILGFGVLTGSGFQLNADLAIVTILTLSGALLVDLVVLPALLAGREIRHVRANDPRDAHQAAGAAAAARVG